MLKRIRQVRDNRPLKEGLQSAQPLDLSHEEVMRELRLIRDDLETIKVALTIFGRNGH